MKLWIDFDECLKDSPKFRTSLEENEHSIWELESHLEKLVKTCTQVIDVGKAYQTAMTTLVTGLETLSSLFNDDEFVSTALTQLTECLTELHSFTSIFLEQMRLSITNGILNFVKDDIKKVRETKKVFDKISDDFDSAVHRNGQLLKNCKTQDAEECENVLTATLSCFSHTALDYAFLINSVQSKRRFHILYQIVAFMNAHFSHYKQGCEVLHHFEPYQEELSSQLENLQTEFLSNMKEMEERHTLVQIKNTEDDQITKKSLPRTKNNIIMDGYLFKRASNAFKTWHRRWFVIQNNKLYYQKRSKSGSITEMVDLRLSTVKHAEDLDRRFTFAVVCPTKCWYLQADNAKLRDRWIAVMQMAIVRALNESDCSDDSQDEFKEKFDNLEKLHPQFLLTQIRSLEGNDVCADCCSLNPKWASINLGVVLCIECSGIHRSLGVHISKVRSITLDDWEAESIKLMTELGNNVVNNIYEADIDPTFKKPSPSSSRQDREAWINAKYVRKRFISKVRNARRLSRTFIRKGVMKKGKDGVIRTLSSSPVHQSSFDKDDLPEELNDSEEDIQREGAEMLPPNLLLYQSARTKNIPMMALAVASGAEINWRNSDDHDMTPLLNSIASGSVTASEYLLQNGADVNMTDDQGRNSLHHAALLGSTGHTCLFLKRNANQQALDHNKQDPLMIALHNYHADIVTLLRLALLHEEIKETDINMGGDEVVTNVFRDFSNMASQNPEKLKRDRHTAV